MKGIKKMIDLQIEAYCNECNDFEVEQETVILGAGYLDITQHNLKCVHSEKCKVLKKHLERGMENGKA